MKAIYADDPRARAVREVYINNKRAHQCLWINPKSRTAGVFDVDERGKLIVRYVHIGGRRVPDPVRPVTLRVKRGRIKVVLRRDAPLAVAHAWRAVGVDVAIADE